MRGFSKAHRVLTASVAVLALILGSSTLASPAHAWSTSDFNPGRIIEDSLFYDGNAMNAAEVQEFLNRQVPNCTIGTVDYKQPGSTLRTNNPVASKCLKDLRITTQSKPANANCSAYVGAVNETAAEIIAKVGKACGISQKVLLVTLEKEQSLITDSWPTTRMFNYAMGWGCPDSGPGNTANCNSEGAGFAYQMYQSGWQFKQYRANPNSPSWSRYQPFKTATIKWHPEDWCGTSNVYLENYATTALYIYTPYRPNQAAINAGWGHGDACSSYGNRNFFNLYNQWFGSPLETIAVVGGIKVIWDRAKQSGFDYGKPLESRRTISVNGGGWQQSFEHGVITESWAQNRTFGLPAGMFSQAYLAQGGASGAWGFLSSEPRGETARGDRAVDTQNGTIIYTNSRGIQYLPKTIHTIWQQSGAYLGSLGYPAAEADTPSSTSVSQLFSNGSTIMASGGSGTVVTSAELDRWKQLGGFERVGFLIADRVTVGSRSYRHSELGTVFESSGTQLFIGNGQFLNAYFEAGGPTGTWGWPQGEKTSHESGISSIEFEGGTALHSPRFGVSLLQRDSAGEIIPRLVDIDASGFANEILWLSMNSITTGYQIELGAAEFRPFEPVSRQAMAAFLYRYAGSPDFEAPTTSPFIDVPTSNPFYKEIAWLAHTGISKGWAVGNGAMEFRPFQNIARDAMAAFLYRYAGLPEYSAPESSPFADVTTSSIFYKEISWLASTEISGGWETQSGNREYRPGQNIARDAMSAFLYRHSTM